MITVAISGRHLVARVKGEPINHFLWPPLTTKSLPCESSRNLLIVDHKVGGQRWRG